MLTRTDTSGFTGGWRARELGECGSGACCLWAGGKRGEMIKSISAGIRGACVLLARGTGVLGTGARTLRRALRRARLTFNGCGGSTAGDPNGGKGLGSCDSG